MDILINFKWIILIIMDNAQSKWIFYEYIKNLKNHGIIKNRKIVDIHIYPSHDVSLSTTSQNSLKWKL